MGRLLRGLTTLRHANGSAAVRVHGPNVMDRRGGTVAFTRLDDAQTVVDYERVVDSAAEQGICLRGGCFCNPGCAERAFDYSADELDTALDVVGDDFSIPVMRAALHGKPVGAVRASLGYGSDRSDVEALLEFLNQFVIGRGFPD